MSGAATSLKREMLRAAGVEPTPEEVRRPSRRRQPERPSAGWCRSRSSPGSSPTRSWRPTSPPSVSAATAAGHLDSWELLGPLFRSFEYGGASSCMDLPEPASLRAPGGLELMPHQARVVAAAAAGHRTFLLADEPGLGKTAQALLAAQAADAYPLLVVVPNVVKTNWAREAGLWTPDPPRHGHPRQRRHDRRVRRHRRRQLRGARPSRRLARRLRLPRHGRRRGALHQEQDVPALPARPAALRPDPGPRREAAADGADRDPADQRHRGLQGDLAVPRLDRREEAPARADGGARGDRADPGRLRVLRRRPRQRDRPRHRPSPQGRRGRRHPRPSHRRPARRARRRGRPLDPRRRAGARPPPGGAVRDRARDPHLRRPSSRASTTSSYAGSPPGSAGGDRHQDRRERVQRDATHRPGQGRSGRRLRRAARAQRRQGRLLRQARRRDGRRRGDLRQARHPLRLDPRRPDPEVAPERTSTRSSTTRRSRSWCAR